MDHAAIISKIFGPFLVFVGLWMLLYNENSVKTQNSFKNNPAVVYQKAVFNLLIGIGLIRFYNVWAWWDPTILATWVGWMLAIRGVLVLFIPQRLIKLTMTNKTVIKLRGLVPLVWGLLLCGLGF